MIRSLRIAGCCVAVAMMAATANANKVNVDLVVNFLRGTWDLNVTAKGANDGISGYSIEVLGADTLDHLQIGSAVPCTECGADNFLTGMTLFDTSDDGVLFGGQNSTALNSIIYGIGSPDFNVEEPTVGENRNMPDVGSPFGPVTLARGTYDLAGAKPQITEASLNVWTQGEAEMGGVDARRAQVNISVIQIPEPTACALLGLAMVGLAVARRRG